MESKANKLTVPANGQRSVVASIEKMIGETLEGLDFDYEGAYIFACSTLARLEAHINPTIFKL